MGGAGCRHVLNGAWPAWMGRRRPCRSRGSGVGAEAEAAGVAGKAQPPLQWALDQTGWVSAVGPGGDLGDRRAGAFQETRSILALDQALPPP